MRAFLRFIGMLLAAGAFVSFVVDGTKSIADNALYAQPLRDTWLYLSPASYEAARAAVDTNFSPLLWQRLVETTLMVPLFAVLLMLSLVLLFLGRRPRSRIGYATRG
jgi:hypothetical protein